MNAPLTTVRRPPGVDAGAGIAPDADYVARARGLADIITGEAAASEQAGRLTARLQDALLQAGLFRLLLPRVYGGAELAPAQFSRVTQTIAALDGSTAWCVCQGNGCAMLAAWCEPETAREIWADDPAGVLAWGPGKVTAVEDGDGYRVNGTIAFASGGRRATWLGMHATLCDRDGTPRRRPDGAVALRTMLYPADSIAWNEIWDVIGLRATGSDGYTVRDRYVPRRYTAGREYREELHCNTPLYQFPATSLYASGFSGTALGLARGMLQAFKDLAQDKRPRLAKQTLRDNSVVQAEVARSEIRLNAARTWLLHELEAIWAEVCETLVLTVDHRMRIRLATTHAIHEAKEVADTVYDLAGASAIFADSPFERRYRDIRTVTQQLQGRKTHYQTVGAHLLGVESDLSSA